MVSKFTHTHTHTQSHTFPIFLGTIPQNGESTVQPPGLYKPFFVSF